MTPPKVYRPTQARVRLLRAEVIARDGGGCFYCDEPGAITLDHIIPQADGGRWVASNLVMACETCNHRRGTLDAGAFLQIVKSEQARGQAPVPLKRQRKARRQFQGRYPWLGGAYDAR